MIKIRVNNGPIYKVVEKRIKTKEDFVEVINQHLEEYSGDFSFIGIRVSPQHSKEELELYLNLSSVATFEIFE